jgi:hypothetical protein
VISILGPEARPVYLPIYYMLCFLMTIKIGIGCVLYGDQVTNVTNL